MYVRFGTYVYMVFKQLSTSMEILGKQNGISHSLLRVSRLVLLLVGDEDRLRRNQRTLVNTFVSIRSIIYGVSGVDLGFVERKYVYS